MRKWPTVFPGMQEAHSVGVNKRSRHGQDMAMPAGLTHLEKEDGRMKSALRTILVGGAMTLLCAGAWAQSVTLKPVPTGATPMIGGYMPQRLPLSTTRPAAVRKAPADLKAPMYGTLAIGGKSFAVLIDRPEGAANRIFIDSNADGDLTNDAAIAFSASPYKSRDGKELAMHRGSALVPLDLAGQTVPVSLGVYIFDRNDPEPGRAAIRDALLYYSDYAVRGEMVLGGKSYTVLLTDDLATGDFRGKDGAAPASRLLIDRDGDGKFDRRFESYDPGKPFNLGGVTYQLQGIAANGSKFEVVKSTQTVAEIAPPPALHTGKQALTFEAKTTDGKSISFPTSFKGKVVMLDFWAMWCGPCVGELPNLTAAYQQYHNQGFEILGISLDQPNMAEKLAAFTKEHNMPWAQVYEGKLWDVSLVRMHGVNAIPFAILVDGDTGEIVGEDLRGAALPRTIAAALEKKKARGTLSTQE